MISLGIARVEGAEKARELAALFDSVPVGHFDELTYRHYFAEQLPGIELDESENKYRFKIFEPVRDNDRDEAIRKGRLSSPDHYRLYFALTGPSHALTQDDLTSMWAAAEDGADQAGEMLLHLHEKPVAGSLTKADVLMERIRGGAYEVLTPEQCEHLLIALSQVMDECYRSQPFDLFWINSLWDRSERSIASLLSRLQPARRASAISTIFSGGRAIGWLTSLFRQEIFAHGRCGDKPRREEKCLFTDSELDEITKSMLHRYRAMPASDVFGCPSPISLLFAWLQGGDEQGVRQFVQENIVSDDALVAMLERFLSPVDSSNRGRFNVLRKENISLFMDYKEALARVHALKEHCDLGAQATRLAAAFDDGAEY